MIFLDKFVNIRVPCLRIGPLLCMEPRSVRAQRVRLEARAAHTRRVAHGSERPVTGLTSERRKRESLRARASGTVGTQPSWKIVTQCENRAENLSVDDFGLKIFKRLIILINDISMALYA